MLAQIGGKGASYFSLRFIELSSARGGRYSVVGPILS
jgi:hypothetical protein